MSSSHQTSFEDWTQYTLRRFTVSSMSSDHCWLHCGLRGTGSYYRREERAALHYLPGSFRSTRESRGLMATAYSQIYEATDTTSKRQRYPEGQQ